MKKLNLTAQTDEEKIILEHLTPMVSDTLAEKINNGVYIVKDGKRLLNKKTLSTFMSFLCEEAYKLLDKGAPKISFNGRNASVKGMSGEAIMGMAIHYFEEDSIEGSLYNEDGTEYKQPEKAKSKSPVKAATVAVTPSKPQSRQGSLFDLLTNDKKDEPEEAENKEEPDDEDMDEDDTVIDTEEDQKTPDRNTTPWYSLYLKEKAKYPDCLIFVRLGDFYEALNEDADTIAAELDLTLTGRDVGLEHRVPIVGVPYHAFDTYLSKLVDKGYKVAVIEELIGKQPKERIVSGKTLWGDGQTVDAETGEIISEEIPTISKALEETDISDDENFDMATERERLKCIDTEGMCILADLLDGKMSVV